MPQTTAIWNALMAMGSGLGIILALNCLLPSSAFLSWQKFKPWFFNLMPLECTAIEAQTWLLRASVWAQFVHCQIREIPKRPIRGLYPEGVSCRKSSFILKEKWEALKNRSLAHCSEYDFCKSDFTPSKIRENEVLLCSTMVWALWITQILRGKWIHFEEGI